MWKLGILLEHGVNIAFLSRQTSNIHSVYTDATSIWLIKTCNQPHNGGLTVTGSP